MSTEQFDYVIVGAGAAGCLLADRLTRDGKTRVLLLEAGGHDRYLWVKVPAGFTRTVYDRRVNWCFETETQSHCHDRRIFYPRGKGLGGSSSINGHLFVRGNSFDFDSWSKLGNEGWSYDEVLPFFKSLERRDGPIDSSRGADGELWVSNLRDIHPLTERFLEAGQQVGVPANPDYNGFEQEGVGYAQQMMRNGKRFSAADAWLRPAMARGLVKVEQHALVDKVIVDGHVVTGVSWRRDGKEHFAKPSRELILSAGAIQSPQLLQRSGICGADLAQEIGVSTVHHLPGVGENLRDHYAARVVYRLNRQLSINHQTRGWRVGMQALKWLFTGRGVLAMSPAHGMMFARSRPDQVRPDVQIVFAPGSYVGGKTGQADMEEEPGMTCGIWQLRNESTGSVRARDSDPLSTPRIDPNYLAHPEDQAAMINGIRLARNIMKSAAFDDVRANEVLPGASVESDEQILDYARETGNTVYHPVGTCKMGVDPMSVVDDQLRIHGLKGIRVVDASVMPTMVSGNCYAPTLMVAEKGAAMIQSS